VRSGDNDEDEVPSGVVLLNRIEKVNIRQIRWPLPLSEGWT